MFSIEIKETNGLDAEARILGGMSDVFSEKISSFSGFPPVFSGFPPGFFGFPPGFSEFPLVHLTEVVEACTFFEMRYIFYGCIDSRAFEEEPFQFRHGVTRKLLERINVLWKTALCAQKQGIKAGNKSLLFL
jgi:hypothetical protein